ncbi:MAG: hypothetical protein ACI8QS_001446 [Planctomycetota bacterium]|jgi:hypothetical protein
MPVIAEPGRTLGGVEHLLHALIRSGIGEYIFTGGDHFWIVEAKACGLVPSRSPCRLLC